ncbi:MAG TPA: nitrite/sulfite reductase, partial [Chthonomonadales bacterium]|nr:nitrite/sulfite reductase [Chthonomonadales bacterium]
MSYDNTGTWQKPDSVSDVLWQDVLEIREAFGAYLQGQMPESEFRRFRLLRGIYGQRQPGVNMVRVKLPLGRVTAGQLRCLAEISQRFANGKAHVTTRQDIQFHFVPTPRVPEMIARLAKANLTTREACGNTVRNVTACALAGVCPHEHFDMTPYALAVSRYFLRHPLVQNLPRKFKIAFSGCEKDCALAAINDIGLVATVKETADANGKGFRMMVGGGLGPTPEVAHSLQEFVPADELIPLCEAVLRVFDRHGERRNRNRARLKFLIRRIGMEALAEYVAQEREKLPSHHPIEELAPDTFSAAISARTNTELPPGFDQWQARNVAAQKQSGYYAVTVFAPKGDLTADQLSALADAADQFGNSTARTTHDQNVVLPWVHELLLPTVYAFLQAAGLAEPYAGTVADVVSCPAAASCRLGITRAKDLADYLIALARPLAEEEDLRDVSIKMSGCPNSCGQHHLGTFGFHGAAATVNGQKAPCYQVLVGGRGKGGVTLAHPLARVPARRIPEVVRRLIGVYRQHRVEGESL